VDAIALLEAEHASARELLALLLRMQVAGRNRERVVSVLTEDLWILMQMEEEIFYPALAGTGAALIVPPLARPAVCELLFQLERCHPNGPELLLVAKRLLDLHEDDSADEERLLFPHARRVLSGDALITLGDRLRARRQELRESGLVRREPHCTTMSRQRLGA
jgi:hypothetical protein